MRSGKHVSPLCSGLRAGSTVSFLMWLCVLPANAQEKASPVGTVYAERQQVAQTRDYVGRVNAIDRVEVQARVKGYYLVVTMTSTGAAYALGPIAIDSFAGRGHPWTGGHNVEC